MATNSRTSEVKYDEHPRPHACIAFILQLPTAGFILEMTLLPSTLGLLCKCTA